MVLCAEQTERCCGTECGDRAAVCSRPAPGSQQHLGELVHPLQASHQGHHSLWCVEHILHASFGMATAVASVCAAAMAKAAVAKSAVVLSEVDHEQAMDAFLWAWVCPQSGRRAPLHPASGGAVRQGAVGRKVGCGVGYTAVGQYSGTGCGCLTLTLTLTRVSIFSNVCVPPTSLWDEPVITI